MAAGKPKPIDPKPAGVEPQARLVEADQLRGPHLMLTHVGAGKRTDGEEHLVDLDVRLLNGDGEEKVVGEATAVVPGRS